MSELAKSILLTINYFDALDYAPTVFEIWKHLIVKSEKQKIKNGEYFLKDIVKELESDEIKKQIEQFQGFYFLPDWRELAEKRVGREKISVAKIKRLRKIVWFLRWSPFMRAILVTGRLAMKNAEVSSDWDVLVILKSGRIWTGRFFLTALVHLLGKRRYSEKVKDRICLNYFITDHSLEISEKNFFSANEYSFTFPVFDSGNIAHNFKKINSWIADFKPNYFVTSNDDHLFVLKDSNFSKFFRQCLEKIFDYDFLENKMRIWQKNKIKNNPKTFQSGSAVSFSDEALVFLPAPRGPKILKKFRENIRKIPLLS